MEIEACPYCDSALNEEPYCDHVVAIYDNTFHEFVFLQEDKLDFQGLKDDSNEVGSTLNLLYDKFKYGYYSAEGYPGFSSQEIFFFSAD